MRGADRAPCEPYRASSSCALPVENPVDPVVEHAPGVVDQTWCGRIIDMVSPQAGGAADGEYDGRPVAALRRIAFLLERSRAETYKVKAFRAAAETILPLGDEVEQRVAEGTLRELPGIGASTAEAIEAVVH